MKSFELHVIRSGLDARLAEIAGLPDLDITQVYCTGCSVQVGLDGWVGKDDQLRFEPFVLVLGADDSHRLYCADCADPVVDVDKS